MNEFALAEWGCAGRSIASAERLADSDPDSAVSRAYYAAFHAVNALFALRGKSFTKHSSLRAAIHRELIRQRRVAAGVGRQLRLPHGAAGNRRLRRC